MDLFSEEPLPKDEPLASRMRPRKLAEFFGHAHLLGEDGFLRRALQKEISSQTGLSNIILWGPPGSGKTTLALLLAKEAQRPFLRLSAVLDGLKELRSCLAEARSLNTAPILFVDEIHRWNKAQQDALLPWVEQGTVLLVGATTENPAFELNNALLSRVRILELAKLGHDDLQQIMDHTLSDEQHGLGNRISLQPEAQNYLIEQCSGDARRMLNALEQVAHIHEGSIDIKMVQQCLKHQNIYDRNGDYHYDTISAFIKSVRGSSVDDALYWLQVMLQGGEQPLFILRRLLILAAEDIGLADPQALLQVQAAAQAFERVGLPEGQYFLSQATMYLALAPKSNSVGAFWQAKAIVAEHGPLPVPPHLRSHAKSSNKRQAENTAVKPQIEDFNYLYPHDYRGNWIEQAYSDFDGKFYLPGTQGWERERGQELQRRREILAEARRLSQNTQASDQSYWENRHELLLAWDELRNKLAHALRLELGEAAQLSFIGRSILPPLDKLLSWLGGHSEFLRAETNYPSETFLQQAWAPTLGEAANKTLLVNHLLNWPALFAQFSSTMEAEFWKKFQGHMDALAGTFTNDALAGTLADDLTLQKKPQVLFLGEYALGQPLRSEACSIFRQLSPSLDKLGQELQQWESGQRVAEGLEQEFFSLCRLRPLQSCTVSYVQILHPKLWRKLGQTLPDDLREHWLQAYPQLLAERPQLRATFTRYYTLWELRRENCPE